MFKRIVRDILIVFGIAVLGASTSRTFMQYVSEWRDGDKWWCAYPCLHGDLVSLSYLDFVKKFNPPGPKPHLKRATWAGAKNTVLVLHGDSNTWHVTDSNFAGVATLYFVNRTNGGYYHLDTAKRNILIIEVGEHYLRSYFEGLQIFDEVRDTGVIRQKISFRNAACKSDLMLSSFFSDIHFSDLFNRYINQNLQCNLFNYNFIMPMFESKAALNYYLFNRASGDVIISNDRNFLFLKETVTKTDIGSSYSPVNKDEVARIVATVNTIYDHYKKIGFNEVYFSIIPNSATIMQPEGYNNLIPLVQNDPQLRMKIIDVYSVFKNSPEVFYQHGDTHWNREGKQLWIDLVNKRLTN